MEGKFTLSQCALGLLFHPQQDVVPEIGIAGLALVDDAGFVFEEQVSEISAHVFIFVKVGVVIGEQWVIKVGRKSFATVNG